MAQGYKIFGRHAILLESFLISILNFSKSKNLNNYLEEWLYILKNAQLPNNPTIPCSKKINEQLTYINMPIKKQEEYQDYLNRLCEKQYAITEAKTRTKEKLAIQHKKDLEQARQKTKQERERAEQERERAEQAEQTIKLLNEQLALLQQKENSKTKKRSLEQVQQTPTSKKRKPNRANQTVDAGREP